MVAKAAREGWLDKPRAQPGPGEHFNVTGEQKAAVRDKVLDAISSEKKARTLNSLVASILAMDSRDIERIRAGIAGAKALHEIRGDDDEGRDYSELLETPED